MLSLLHVWQTWLSHHRCGDVGMKAWGSVNVEEACVWMTQSRYLPSLCAAVTGDTCRRNPWMRTTNCHTRHLMQKEGFSECAPDLLCHYTQAFPVSRSLSLTGHTHTRSHTHYPFSTSTCMSMSMSHVSALWFIPAAAAIIRSLIGVRCLPAHLLCAPLCVYAWVRPGGITSVYCAKDD